MEKTSGFSFSAEKSRYIIFSHIIKIRKPNIIILGTYRKQINYIKDDLMTFTAQNSMFNQTPSTIQYLISNSLILLITTI